MSNAPAHALSYRAERVSWVQVDDLRGADTFAYDGEVQPATDALRLEKRRDALVVYRPAVPGGEIAQQARLAAAVARHRNSERGCRLPADGGPSASAD
ncbi:hypothetical protein [Streptomyces chiangmaiensis]|uniref:Uncharacterized protein n=1 Tax=Streptomyces chiangmaiensis TaxID=766497 RepID=A0ABU7FTI2_9ACTN|nr:hypothetical protein [Streptomyces chiangmaiensis]MED7827215.1 hypothetical protein [Streptomyces chiangmaiensis]